MNAHPTGSGFAGVVRVRQGLRMLGFGLLLVRGLTCSRAGGRKAVGFDLGVVRVAIA